MPPEPKIEKRESPILYGRALQIERGALTEEGRTVPVIFSTDDPALVSDGHERFYEILDHSPGSIRMGRANKGLPLLKDHVRTSLLGRVNDISFGPSGSINVGGGAARFAKTEEARGELDLVRDGTLTDVSVGYRVFKRVSEGKMDGLPLFRATDWMPTEVSTVSIGADEVAGFRADEGPNELTIEWRQEEMDKCKVCEKEHADLNTRGVCPDCIGDMTRQAVPAKPAAQAVRAAADLPATPEELEAIRVEAAGTAKKDETERVREIISIGEEFKMQDQARKAVDENVPLDEFRKEAMELIRKNSRPGMVTSDDLGMNRKEKDEYSLCRAMLSMLGDKDYSKGFEKEVHDDLLNKVGSQRGGFLIPSDMVVPAAFARQRGAEMARQMMLMERTTMIAGTDSLGGHLVGTEHRADMFLDFLRARTVLGEMGSQIMEGLVGNIEWPTQATDPTFSYLATETGSLTESNLTFGQNTMSPKIATAKQSYSRKLLRQSNPSIENVVRNAFLNGFASEVDRLGITGASANNEPVGILNTSGIGAVAIGTDGGAITWGSVVDLETEVAIDNADFGALGYITNPKVRGAAKQTLKDAAVSGYVWSDMSPGAPLNGFRAGVTTNVPSNLTKGSGTGLSALIYGNFNDALYGFWGAMEIEEDRITNADSGGGIVIRLFHFLDFLANRPQSFSAAKDINTT